MAPELPNRPSTVQDEARLRIAHVLFADIVGYSLLPTDEQSRVVTQLQTFIRDLPGFAAALAAEELICIPTGDGLAIACFVDPNMPAQFAVTIATRVRNEANFGLRLGLNSGPVYNAADINGRQNISGAGINMAQRVMDCADAGHILMSESVAETLRQLSQWKDSIHDLGECEVKHGVRLRILNLFNEAYGNPAVPAKLQRSAVQAVSKSVPESHAAVASISGQQNRAARRMFMAGALLLCAGIGTGAWYWKFRASGNLGSASSGSSEKYRKAVELMKRWDKQGNLDNAKALLTDSILADPAFALGFARLAEAERLEYALSRDPKALEEATKHAEEAKRLNPELAIVQVAYGRVQALHGNGDLAMASFERAIRIDPNDADGQLAIARQYERLGRLADAEAAFQKAGQLEPDSIAAHDFYANFQYRQGKFEAAAQEWQTVIQLAPDHAAALVNLGAALGELGRLDEAITAYKQALQAKPTDMAYNNLGAMYERKGRNPEAMEAFRQAFQLASSNYLFAGNLAAASSRISGLGQQAQQYFAKAIELGEQVRKANPRDATVHKNLAVYYAQTGKTALALQRVGTALALADSSPEIHAGAAGVYEELGQRKPALAQLKRSMELGYSRQRLAQDPAVSGLLAELK